MSGPSRRRRELSPLTDNDVRSEFICLKNGVQTLDGYYKMDYSKCKTFSFDEVSLYDHSLSIKTFMGTTTTYEWSPGAPATGSFIYPSDPTESFMETHGEFFCN